MATVDVDVVVRARLSPFNVKTLDEVVFVVFNRGHLDFCCQQWETHGVGNLPEKGCSLQHHGARRSCGQRRR